MTNYDQIINRIEKIRAANNKNWMALLKLAFEVSPEKAGKIFKKITNNDRKINDLSEKLGSTK